MAIPAQLRGWGKGWPTNRQRDMLPVVTKHGQVVWVHKEIAPILQHVFNEIERRGYSIHKPGDIKDDWGFANRPIGGTKTPSEHSRGLAVDLDATKYPQGQRRARPPQWIVDLFAQYGFEWGGPWSFADPMHFEFAGSVTEARWLVASLAAGHLVGKPAPLPAATPVAVIPPPYRPLKETDMIWLVQAPGDPKVYATDLKSKTHIPSKESLGGHQIMLAKRGLPNNVEQVSAKWLAEIPTEPSDAERLKTIAYVIEGARK